MRVTLFECIIVAPNRNAWKTTVEAPDSYAAYQMLNGQYPGVLYNSFGGGPAPADGGFRCQNLTALRSYDR